MTDDDQFCARALGTLAVSRCGSFEPEGPVILRYSFERAQKVSPLGGDLPPVAIAKHMAAGENIDGPNPSGETPHPRAPLGAAGGENGNVPLE
jgi:hypothetical protein